DQRRDLLGAVDADPGAEQPAARAVATRLVRRQSEALAHHASTLASGAARGKSRSRLERGSDLGCPLARVDGLEPLMRTPAVGRQAIFLGTTEPRAARPGKTCPQARRQ